MNTPMPDAPPNAMMGPQGPPAGGGGVPQPQGGPAPNMMMGGPQGAFQGAPASPQGPPPTPEEIATSRKHVGAIIDGLVHLTSTPRGELTKDDVFKAASDMIAKGAFPTSAARQQLVVGLAKLPDDEPSLRKALGGMLLRVADARQQLHGVFGAGEAQAPAQGGPPSAGI